VNTKRLRWRWAIILLVAALAARADFFWRFPATASAVLKGLGGNKTYSTDVNVNGVDGSLTVFSFVGTSVRDLSGRVAAKLKLSPPQPANGAVMLSREQNGRREMVLVLPAPDGSDRCSAVAVEGLGGEAGAPSWPDRVPQVLPGELRFSARCEQTRCSFVSTECAEPQSSALAQAADGLVAAGWKAASPENNGCAIFTLGKKQCIISAFADGKNGRTVMGLLHREGAN